LAGKNSKENERLPESSSSRIVAAPPGIVEASPRAMHRA
jgi:hypothetical protein